MEDCEVPFAIKFALLVAIRYKVSITTSPSVATTTSPPTTTTSLPRTTITASPPTSNPTPVVLVRLVHHVLQALARLQGAPLFDALDTIKNSIRADSSSNSSSLLQLVLNNVRDSTFIHPHVVFALVVLYSSQISSESHPAHGMVPWSGMRNCGMFVAIVMDLIKDGRLSFAMIRSCFTHPIFVSSRFCELFVS